MKKILLLAVIALLVNSIYSQTIVSGNVTGVWEPGGNPYIVTGDVYVVDSLIIHAGVNVKFQVGGWKIEAGSGDKFIAKGTNENPIVFEPYQGFSIGLWDKIYFYESGNDDTIMYCKIRNANIGIHVHRSRTCICKNTIIDNDIGVQVTDYGYTSYAIAEVINCSFVRNNTALYVAGYYGPDALIKNSIIAKNYDYGIRNTVTGQMSSGDILYNCFWENGANFSGISIPYGFGSNEYQTNYNGDSCDINFNIYYDPCFTDTTNNNFKLQPISKCIDAGTNLILGQFTYDPDSTMPDMGANYYQHSSAAILAYSFPEQTEPADIDPVNKTIDVEVVYGTDVTNLVADFNLAGGATATVNGVPQIPGVTSNDFTFPVTYVVTSDRGTNVQNWLVTVNVATSIYETKVDVLNIYPNPFSSKTTISFNNPEHQEYYLCLYDLSGKRVLEIKQITFSSFELKRGSLEAGVYILELIYILELSGENAFRKKLVVK